MLRDDTIMVWVHCKWLHDTTVCFVIPLEVHILGNWDKEIVSVNLYKGLPCQVKFAHGLFRLRLHTV